MPIAKTCERREKMISYVDEEYVHSLQKIGLTALQAKIYMVMVRSGKDKTLAISRKADVDRSNTYRTILQLQKMGLVTKILGTPNLYMATPLEDAVSALIERKKTEYQVMQEVADELKRMAPEKECGAREKEPIFFIVKMTKERMLKSVKTCCRLAQEKIDLLFDKQMLFSTVVGLVDHQLGCVKRGVKYRLISEQVNLEATPELLRLIAEPNFQIRYITGKPKTELVLVDDKQMVLYLVPNEGVAYKTHLFTDHPGCIEIFGSHFEKIWNEAHEYKPDLGRQSALNRN